MLREGQIGSHVPDRLLWKPFSPGQLLLGLQLPFLAGVAFTTTATAIAVPSLWTHPGLIAGAIIAVAATGLFLTPVRHVFVTGYVVVVPVLDIVAIGLTRAALLPYLPAVGMLCLIPFAWIAYRFRWPGLIAVFAGGVLIAAMPFALGAGSATTMLAVLNVIALPLIATGISLGIHWGAIQFRRGRAKIEEASARLRSTLAQAQDGQLLLRSVFDTFAGAVAFYDARNELVLANTPATQLVETAGFRLDVPPYAGSNVLMSDRTTPIPLDEQIIPRALRGEVIASHIEWLGAPGSQIAIMASSRRVHRDDGELLGTLVVAYDVTELANAIEVREEFLTTVSHELRTPLTSIIGYTDLVIDALGDDAGPLGVERQLETIARNADILLDRVGLLLDAGDKHIELTVATTDVTRLLHEMSAPLALLAQRAGISLEVAVPPGLSAELDAARITQAVENLLTNAIKFTGRGGSIEVAGRSDDPDSIHITVTDTGIGMTPDEQRRIFDRFYRSQAVRQNAIQGIGVGLSIVKTIVTAHRGRVDVESAPGRGTSITLCLPRRHRPDGPDATR